MDNSGRLLVPTGGGTVSEELVTAVPSHVNYGGDRVFLIQYFYESLFLIHYF